MPDEVRASRVTASATLPYIPPVKNGLILVPAGLDVSPKILGTATPTSCLGQACPCNALHVTHQILQSG